MAPQKNKMTISLQKLSGLDQAFDGSDIIYVCCSVNAPKGTPEQFLNQSVGYLFSFFVI